MLSMRSLGLASRRAVLTVFASLMAFTISTFVGNTAVFADDRPFWEQDEPVAPKKSAAKKKLTYKAKKSGKSYASKAKKKTYASSSSKKLGGYAEQTEQAKPKKKGVKVAALGKSYYSSEDKPKKSLSGGVSWSAPAGCLDGSLKAVINEVASNYGPLRVNSTCRSKGHNRSVGGAPKSKHLSGDAADFRVFGNVGAVYAFLKSHGSVGGLKHYGGGLFHIDNGERRSW